MKVISILFFITFLISCDDYFEEKEIYGIYTPIDYKNNYDTLQLKPNGLYSRKVYDKNNRLMLEMNGKWGLVGSNSQINFNNFYLNLDHDLLEYPEQVNDTLWAIVSVLDIKNKTIHFCIGMEIDSCCYQKSVMSRPPAGRDL